MVFMAGQRASGLDGRLTDLGVTPLALQQEILAFVTSLSVLGAVIALGKWSKAAGHRAPTGKGGAAGARPVEVPDLPPLDRFREGIAYIDAAGHLALGNTKLFELLGREPGELLGITGLEWVPDDVRPAIAALMKEQPHGALGQHEAMLRRPDGTAVEVLLSANPIRGADGSCSGWLATFTELNELQRIHGLLRASGETFQTLANTLGAMVWEIDPDRHICTFVNPLAKRLLGYPLERWQTERGFWVGILHPRDRRWILRRCAAAVREQKGHTIEFRVIAADGREVWLRTYLSVVGEKGRVSKLRAVAVETTDRQLAERVAALARSRDFLPAFGGVGLYGLNKEGKLTLVNPRGAAILGLSRSELFGQDFPNLWQVYRASGRPWEAETCHAPGILCRGRSTVVDKVVCNNGSPISVELSADPILEGEDLLGWVVTLLAHSDSLHVEQKRDSASTLLRAAAQVSAELYSWTDPSIGARSVLRTLGSVTGASHCYWFERQIADHGRRVLVSRAGWVAAGITPQLDPLPVLSLAENALPRFAETLLRGEPLAVTVSQLELEQRAVLEATGARSLLMIPLAAEGEVVHVLGFVDCWQERPWTESQVELLRASGYALMLALDRHRLARQRDELLAVVEQAHDAVVVADLAGEIVYSNPAFLRLAGFLPRHLRDLDGLLVFEGDESARKTAWTSRVAAGEVWRGTARVQPPGSGGLELEAFAFPLRTAAGEVKKTCLLLVDVSSRLHLQRQLQRAQKFEAIGQFAAGIAHDFNNLVMVTSGTTELAQQRLGVDHPAQEELGTIRTAAGRVTDLSRALLTFVRCQAQQRQTVDLSSVVGGMLPLLRRLLPETVSLCYYPSSEPVFVWADPSQLEQVVLNLCGNARDAMPGGGQLTIVTGRSTLTDTDAATRPGTKPGEHCWLIVKDSGSGMDEGVQAHLFEPGFSTKGPDRGTGLGLSTVYGIVKQHEGFIEVTSRPGQGSAFQVYFPAAAQTASAPQEEAEFLSTSGGNEHLLLVEDNDELRSLLARVLADQGYRVSQARHGGEALAILQTHADIALVVTDVVMPVMGGVELFRQVNSRYPHLAFLFSSGYSAADAGLGELPQGPRLAHMTKPYSTWALLRRIRELLDSPPSTLPCHPA